MATRIGLCAIHFSAAPRLPVMRIATLLLITVVLAACHPDGVGEDTNSDAPTDVAAPAPPPPMQNAYCSVPVRHNENISDRGQSTQTPYGPVIFVRSDAFDDDNLFRFVVAHECGHHAQQTVDAHPPNGYVAERYELSADCWAAQTLTQHNDTAAIEAAIRDAQTQGFVGERRIAEIQRCVAAEGSPDSPYHAPAP